VGGVFTGPAYFNMNPIKVKTELCLLPDDYRVAVFAKDQPEYIPLPALMTETSFVTMWAPDKNELALLLNGAPVTITLYGVDTRRPIHPMKVEVGGTDLR
jgi:hypothetical protein